MAGPGLHRDAFWLYGVIVGLAVRDALTAVVPHLISPTISESRWINLQEGLRLAAFLILISRFYLGSSFYFDMAHAGGAAPSKSYSLDFLFGFMHFLMFYMCAITIGVHTETPTLFRWFIGTIILYDWVWWLFSRDNGARHELLLWAIFNSLTAGLMALVFLIMRYPLNRPSGEAEGAALIVVIVASLIDLAGMMNERSFIKEALEKLRPAEGH